MKYYTLLMLQMVDRQADISMRNNYSKSSRIRFYTNNLDLILVLILRLKFFLYRWYISLLIKIKKKKQEANKFFFERAPAGGK